MCSSDLLRFFFVSFLKNFYSVRETSSQRAGEVNTEMNLAMSCIYHPIGQDIVLPAPFMARSEVLISIS